MDATAANGWPPHLPRLAPTAQAGLPKIRFHDLRQTACSLLLAAGVSIVVASGRGGDLAATPQFCCTTSTLQIRRKKR
jgi:hypothetical protein